MAVQFSADNQAFTSTAGLPSSTYTVTAWIYLSVNRGTYTAFWRHTSTASSGHAIETTSNGTTLALAWAGGQATAGVLPVTTWTRVAFVFAGTDAATFYQGTANAALTVTSGLSCPSFTLDGLYIGAYNNASSAVWLNGRIANFKVYGAVLTQPEIEAALTQYVPVRTANLLRWHPFVQAETSDYSGNGNTLSNGSGTAVAAGPPIPWAGRRRSWVSTTPQTPTVEVGQARIGTANFEISIQAVETGAGITSRTWTVVSGPAEVATTIGTSSLLSWYPATAGLYQLEYEVTNAAGTAYDTVYVTINPGGTVVDTQTVTGPGATLGCNKPTGLAQYDVMLAVQSGNGGDHDEMTPPAGWQPLFEYDVGFGVLHVKGWTLTAGASEPATYSFTQASGSAGVVSITAMRGVVEAGIRADLTFDATTSATRTAPSIEQAVPGSVLLAGAVTDPSAARTWTPPSGMTEQADVQTGTNTTHTVASLLDPGEPTGTRDFTLSGPTTATGGVQWAAVFPMPPDPRRGVDNKSMISFVRTT